MLKFLEERQTNIVPKQAYKAKPYISFGVSLEAPTTFQKEHSMISPTSYMNPFVDLTHLSKNSQNPKKYSRGRANWTQKVDMNQVEEGKIVGTGELKSMPDRYHDSYHTELQKNRSRFRLTKGEFTNYIEKVRANNEVFGPLVGEQRSNEKSLQTKRSIARKSQLHIEKSRDKLQLQKTMRKQSSRYLEKVIDERRAVRSKRDQFYVSYRKELTERKSPKHEDYTLPKVLVHRQTKQQNKPLNFGIFKTIDNSMLNKYIK